jgi:undecaprenyl pyrophosphate phosphatase UppP
LLSLEEPISSVIVGISAGKILVVGIIPFLIGYIALLVLQKMKKSNWLTLFGIYRIVLGILILIAL